jgi:ketosteroid isomerase-like protein
MSQENVEMVRQLINRWNADDLAGMLELLSPEMVGFPAKDQPESSVLRGRAAFAHYFESWHEAWGERTVEVRELVEAGDYVIAVLRLVAQGRASGFPISAHDVHLWRFRDGKAVEYRECGPRKGPSKPLG